MTGQVISPYLADTGEPMVAFKPKVYKGKNNTEKVRDPQECFALWIAVHNCCLSLFMNLIFICGSMGMCVSFHLEERKPVWSGLGCYRDMGMIILFPQVNCDFLFKHLKATSVLCACYNAPC